MSVSARHGENQSRRVHVDAYDQRRSGQVVDVREHERGWPGSGAQLAQVSGGGRENLKIEELTVLQNQLRHRPPLFKQMSWNGTGYYPQKGDEKQLARLAVAEASSVIQQSPDIAARVIWTALNRMGKGGFGNTGPKYTVNGVILMPKQFAPTIPPPIDPVTRTRPESLWDKSATPSRLAPGDRRSYEIALKIATDILDGKIPDPTGGATYFRTGEPPEDGIHADLRDRFGYVEERVDPSRDQPVWYFYREPR